MKRSSSLMKSRIEKKEKKNDLSAAICRLAMVACRPPPPIFRYQFVFFVNEEISLVKLTTRSGHFLFFCCGFTPMYVSRSTRRLWKIWKKRFGPRSGIFWGIEEGGVVDPLVGGHGPPWGFTGIKKKGFRFGPRSGIFFGNRRRGVVDPLGGGPRTPGFGSRNADV